MFVFKEVFIIIRKKNLAAFSFNSSCRHFNGALKVLYVAVELGIAVQIQNIGEGFFHPAPPPQT